jgi:hypothetical protein
VLDIHGTEVSSLPDEELRDVDGLQDDGHHDGRGNLAIQEIILLETISKDGNLPEHHTNAAVGALLHIPAQDARIQLGSPEKVDDNISVASRILRGWEIQPFNG